MVVRSDTGVAAVHPRVCGEHELVTFGPELVTGSSPRVRGTSVVTVRLACENRFIPACAGNILKVINKAQLKSVHPRRMSS